MSTPHNLYDTLKEFTYSGGKTGKYYSPRPRSRRNCPNLQTPR